MTEQDWLESEDPTPMLEALGRKASLRKLKLLAWACCRRIWPLITHGPSREAIEVSERYADHAARWKEWVQALNAAELPWWECDQAQGAAIAAAHIQVAAAKVARAARYAVGGVAILGRVPRALSTAPPNPEALRKEGVAQSALVRDIFGYPFRPVVMNQAWLSWRDGAAVHIAQAIYIERRFQDLPILADALEEAGCTDPEILGHCRGPGEHVRGCWVVDLVLAKT